MKAIAELIEAAKAAEKAAAELDLDPGMNIDPTTFLAFAERLQAAESRIAGMEWENKSNKQVAVDMLERAAKAETERDKLRAEVSHRKDIINGHIESRRMLADDIVALGTGKPTKLELSRGADQRIAVVEAERDRLREANGRMRELLNDKTYLQCKADYNRGHLSHANYLNSKEAALRDCPEATS